MTHYKIIISCCCIFFLSSCFKDYNVEVMDTVQIGESVVYLNGEESDYEPIITHASIDNVIHYSFRPTSNLLPGESRRVSFSLLPLKIDNFILCESRNDCEGGALIGFNHLIGGDLDGFTYKLVNEEDGYFEVTKLDTLQRTVQGHFKVQFKRSTKNGNGDIVKDLPKRLTFEGVFHEEYEVR